MTVPPRALPLILDLKLPAHASYPPMRRISDCECRTDAAHLNNPTGGGAE